MVVLQDFLCGSRRREDGFRHGLLPLVGGEAVGADLSRDEVGGLRVVVGVVAHLEVHFVDGIGPITTPKHGALIPVEQFAERRKFLPKRALDVEGVPLPINVDCGA